MDAAREGEGFEPGGRVLAFSPLPLNKKKSKKKKRSNKKRRRERERDPLSQQWFSNSQGGGRAFGRGCGGHLGAGAPALQQLLRYPIRTPGMLHAKFTQPFGFPDKSV